MNAATTVNAPVDVVFDVLADPSTHKAIDGTGWVRQPLDGKRLTETGQIFRMAMYHENHPDKDYEMANRVEVFDPPRAIAWQPGQGPDDANLEFGGWFWRYDLSPVVADGSHADVRLVGGAAISARAHPVPALRFSAPGELSEASRGVGRRCRI
jgi:hypothetical protein